MSALLPQIESPADLRRLADAELARLAEEIRDKLCELLRSRSAHFASNLGVIELCLALHVAFDFSRDRLIWDTGHQIYPHKLVTGRLAQFATMRTRGGLMGYPNPAESPYDLFMTGHAGCSVSCALGLKAGDDLLDDQRKAVAVVGDGALPSGIVFEALNNAAGLKKDLLVVLNDNQMSICPRVGGLAKALDKARMRPVFSDIKRQFDELARRLPLFGNSVDRLWTALKDLVKANVFGGMLFEELGFHYIGPVDGHDIGQLRDYLIRVQQYKGPTLLHVLTEKGHGVPSACRDPVTFHAPPVFEKVEEDRISLRAGGAPAFTNVASSAIHQQMLRRPTVSVITAAMCQGNKLEKVRDEFPTRFFDTGICEAHAVAFAAGLAKAGLRPIVAIYSTFLQRAYDQLFQEVALQNLPVTFCLDRAGFTGPDGPTHHGAFDIAYLRVFPNFVLLAPGDEEDLPLMINFALEHDGPVAIRYPKGRPDRIDRPAAPVRRGEAEVIQCGDDGCLIAYGALLGEAMRAASRLREMGLDVGVINARFAKPIDAATILSAIASAPFVLTIEEGCVMGGFGAAALEAASQAGLDASHVRCLGIPDRFVLHAERHEQLAEVGLDADGIVRSALALMERDAPWGSARNVASTPSLHSQGRPNVGDE